MSPLSVAGVIVPPVRKLMKGGFVLRRGDHQEVGRPQGWLERHGHQVQVQASLLALPVRSRLLSANRLPR